MKNIFLFIGLAVLLFSCTNEEVVVGNKTTFEVEEVFDAGNVVKGEKILAEFTVKNTGEYPLVIPRVQPSCSCTVGEIPKDPILPGETGKITAKVDTDKLEAGPLTKTLTMISNTEPSNTVLIIRANVIRK